MRSQIKYSRTPMGYVIKKLIEEEGKYRQETLNILTRKTKKNSGPTHLKDLAVNMPLDKFLNDLIKLFKHNKELIKLLNSEKTTIEDIKSLINLDQANDIMNMIMWNILEEDLLEDPIEENENQKYKEKNILLIIENFIGRGLFNGGLYSEVEEGKNDLGIGKNLKKRKMIEDSTKETMNSKFIKPKKNWYDKKINRKNSWNYKEKLFLWHF